MKRDLLMGLPTFAPPPPPKKPFAPGYWRGADEVFLKSPRREVVRSSAGTDPYGPLFGGRSRSIPEGMISDV